MSLNEIKDKTSESMQKSIESLKKDFTTLRTGKVSTVILDNVMVDYYGTATSLNQVATVLATDATTITVSPWEKNLLKDIEKALQSANIGVNPNNDGENIKLFFPPMTVEQRKENVKKAKAMVEKAKIAIRNIRKDANNKIKNLEKEKDITEDESKKSHEDIQKLTDNFTAQSDSLLKSKEAELMKV